MLARKKNRCIGKKQNKLNKTTSSNQNVGSPFYNSEFYLFLVVSSPLEPRVHLHLRSCSSIEWTLAVDNHCSIGSSMHAKSRKRKQLCHVCVDMPWAQKKHTNHCKLTTMLFSRPDMSSSGISLYHPDERLRLMMSANDVGCRMFSLCLKSSLPSDFCMTSILDTCMSFNSNFISSKIAGLRSFYCGGNITTLNYHFDFTNWFNI